MIEAMWAALAAYQPQANTAGHGEPWARMCRERTVDAADDAAAAAAAAGDVAAAYAAAYAAAAYAATWIAYAADADYWAQRAIDCIDKAMRDFWGATADAYTSGFGDGYRAGKDAARQHQALEQQPAQKEPEFFTHCVDQPYDWSEWVCPDPKSYLFKCCDCGLVHEAEFGVVRYKSETEREDCDMVNDPNLQAVFRLRRSQQWSPEDTAHRAGGLTMEQPSQQCRTDGRCQYAIDSGAEGMGHCPKGKCVMSAQPEQEPVAWIYSHGKAKVVSVNYVPGVRATPLYTSPPAQRTWVGLTEEEKHEIELKAGITEDDDGYIVFQIFGLTESKLKEKNT